MSGAKSGILISPGNVSPYVAALMRATVAFDSLLLRQFENPRVLRTLAQVARIMAAMPQFPRLRIKQTAKKESRQINEMTLAAGIS